MGCGCGKKKKKKKGLKVYNSSGVHYRKAGKKCPKCGNKMVSIHRVNSVSNKMKIESKCSNKNCGYTK